MRPSVSRLDCIVVILFVFIQFTVPLGLFIARWINEGWQPASEYKYSWQMYSAAPGGDYVGVTASGDEIPLSTSHLPVVIRGIGYNYAVPRMLCDADPSLAGVKRQTETVALKPFTELVEC